MRCRFLFVVVLSLVFAVSVSADDLWWPGPEYPKPEKAAAPAWLLNRKLNFSRWDGGPLEVCKGMLSGWPYFNAPWPNTRRMDNPKTRRLFDPCG